MSKETIKLLKSALKELDSLGLKVEPEDKPQVRKVLPSAGKTSVSKKKIAKAVKETTKTKKAPVKVKRIEEPVPAEPETKSKPDPFTKKVQTKTVLKDGMVIVEPINNPVDD